MCLMGKFLTCNAKELFINLPGFDLRAHLICLHSISGSNDFQLHQTFQPQRRLFERILSRISIIALLAIAMEREERMDHSWGLTHNSYGQDLLLVLCLIAVHNPIDTEIIIREPNMLRFDK